MVTPLAITKLAKVAHLGHLYETVGLPRERERFARRRQGSKRHAGPDSGGEAR